MCVVCVLLAVLRCFLGFVHIYLMGLARWPISPYGSEPPERLKGRGQIRIGGYPIFMIPPATNPIIAVTPATTEGHWHFIMLVIIHIDS